MPILIIARENPHMITSLRIITKEKENTDLLNHKKEVSIN